MFRRTTVPVALFPALFLFAFFFLLVPVQTEAAYGDVTTYVSKLYHGDSKDKLDAYFDFPEDITVNSGGTFYIADTFNHVIRSIAPDGTVDTVAGTGSYGDTNGNASKAEFAYPRGVAEKNGVVYVADSDNGKIKKISGGKVTTLVDGLSNPEGVTVYGSNLYIAETGGNALKKVALSGGSVSTITSSLDEPKKIAISSDGSFAYIANAGTYQIKKVNLSSGAVSNLAGSGSVGASDGSCGAATFENVWGVHLLDDDTLFVTDGDGFEDYVRQVNIDGCTVETFASDTNMLSINFPRGLTIHGGYLYIASTGIGIIQRYDLTDANENEIFAGANRFNVKRKTPVLVGNPKFMQWSKNKKWLFVSENNRIRKIRRKGRKTSELIAGSVIDNYVLDQDDIERFGDEARFSDIPSFARSKNGKKIFAVDRNNNRIREIIIKTGGVSYLTGAGGINFVGEDDNGFGNGVACPNEFDTGVSGCAYFNRPTGSVLSKNGKYLYVADSGNNRIRRVTVRGRNKGKVTTLAGSGEAGYKDATGKAAQFNAPVGLARSKGGKVIYVADRDNQVIRKINVRTKKVTTLAGTGDRGYFEATFDRAQFSSPEWITRGPDKKLYVSEVGSQRIRLLDLELGVTKLVAGSGNRGFTNGAAEEAEFNNPKGMLVTPNGKKLLVAELFNDQIRAIDINGVAPFSQDAPRIDSVTHNAIAKEWFSDTARIEIKGHFPYGTTAKVGSTDATNLYIQSDSTAVVEIPISSMPAGYYTIQVETADGQTADRYRSLSISENGSVPDTLYQP